MSLDAFFQIWVQGLLMVEFFYDSKELRESVAIIERGRVALSLTQDVDEVSHDVREDCDSKEKHECSKEPFDVPSWCIISETNRG